MRVKRKRLSQVTGIRLAADAKELLDLEVERTGRYPARIVSELIRAHLPSEEDSERSEMAAPAAR